MSFDGMFTVEITNTIKHLKVIRQTEHYLNAEKEVCRRLGKL